MKQKKFVSFLLTLCMLLSMVQVSVFADNSIKVNVSIASQGNLQVAHKQITVTDYNQSGSYDIDDVLYAAHEEYYSGGAENGYASAEGPYGLSITKLWGDTSGAFSYYLNNSSAMGLADTVEDGDYVYAFIYKDQIGWSDAYTYFSVSTASVKKGQTLQVTLNKLGYGENWETIELPVENAAIKINGESTEYKTNAEGVVENEEGVAGIVFENTGIYTLSAEFAETENYTPPVYVVNVTENGDTETPPATEDEDTEAPDTPADEKKDYNVVIPEVLEKIAATYINATDYWIVMDMGAYESYAPQTENKLTDDVRQKYINNAITAIQNSTLDTEIDKTVLGLAAIGKNPELLYPVNSNTAISAIEKLNSVTHSESAWSAPYTLAAYNQGDYNTDQYETELINKLLESQKPDGSWDEWGTIDTTANVIAGLSFYKDRPEVNTAIESAVNYLSTQQNENGAYSANSNSTAMVIIGLCAAGVDLLNDTRFIIDEKNIIDGLLSFLVADGAGFGYTDNTSINAYSTEQAFRALISFMQAVKTGGAYNVYDFSKNEFTPARATGNNSSSSAPSEPIGDNITVTLTIKADTGYWLNNYRVTIPGENATVYHAFVKACSANSITHKGAANGYVSSITKGGKTLGEFDRGENSGWLYKVNDELPTVGLTDCGISDGDNIVWYYTEDWTKDPSASMGGGSAVTQYTVSFDTQGGSSVSKKLVKRNSTLTKPDDPTKEGYTFAGWYTDEELTMEYDFSAKVKEGFTLYAKWIEEKAQTEQTDNNTDKAPTVFTDVKAGSWYEEAVIYAVENNLLKGVSETEFAPDAVMTRAMLVTVLYRLENTTEKPKSHSFTDVKAGEWYADAIAWAVENGIVEGVSETEFAPNDSITREQLSVVLYRYAQYKEQDTSIGEDTNILSYTDAEEISQYAISAIQWMVGAGLINGETDSTINPKSNSTRAQVAVILMRYLEM